MNKFGHIYQHTLVDADDLGSGGGDDRGDNFVPPGDKPPTDEEKKLADELKVKADADKKDADKVVKDEDDDEKKKDTRIPLARHKELLEAERVERAKLEAKLANYEHGEDVAKTNAELQKAEDRLIGLEKEHAKLMNDGKVDEAAQKMGEIRKLERDVNDIRTDLKTAAAESRAYERARYETTVERVEAAYPEMSPKKNEKGEDNPSHDPVKIRKVLSVARAYQLDGFTPSAALQEAVKDILGEPKTKKQDEAVNVKPRVDDADAKKAAREEEARRKAADAADKTPPNGKGVGKDGDALGGGSLSAADVLKMDYKDFVKLDESTLSRMRGDLPT